MPTIYVFEDLEIWILARELAKEVNESILSNVLWLKDFALKDQMNRSSGSVMDNIAEGFNRGGRNEFIYFLGIAKGSCGELKSQFYRCFDRKYLSQEQLELFSQRIELLMKKISTFIKYLNTTSPPGTKFKNRTNHKP